MALAVSTHQQVDIKDEVPRSSAQYRAAGCAVVRQGEDGRPEVLTVTSRWTREFSVLFHGLQGEWEQHGRDVQQACQNALPQLTDAELALLSGATSFWQVAHTQVVKETAATVEVSKIMHHDASAAAGWTERRGRTDIPHVWLKDSRVMNGNIAAVNFDKVQLARLAGDELARRFSGQIPSQTTTHESLPKGEVEGGIDEDAMAAALRELWEESLVSADDVEIVQRLVQRNKKATWLCCRLRDSSPFAKKTAWFTGVGNSESVSAQWRSWASFRKSSRSRISPELLAAVDSMVGRGRISSSGVGASAMATGSMPLTQSPAPTAAPRDINGAARARSIPAKQHRPCRFFSTASGCRKGDSCPFSHTY